MEDGLYMAFFRINKIIKKHLIRYETFLFIGIR